MNKFEIYNAIRTEIISNQVMMHWFSIVVALALLVGIVFVERHKTILSVFLPLLTISWAAAMVRFDFFIQRQAAYLRSVESELRSQGMSIPLWETWKATVRATPFLIPPLDAIVSSVIVIPTIYVLFGPSQEFFHDRQWPGARVYAWMVSALIAFLLCSLAVVPRIATW